MVPEVAVVPWFYTALVSITLASAFALCGGKARTLSSKSRIRIPDLTSDDEVSSTSGDEDSDAETSTKEETSSTPAPTTKTPEKRVPPSETQSEKKTAGAAATTDLAKSKKLWPPLGPKKKDRPIETVTTAAAARSSAALVTPQPAQSVVAHTATSATPVAATRTAVSPEFPVPRRRDHLPREEVPSKPISMLQFKNLPLHAFQPISVLQMVCEELRYAKLLLDKAAQQKDPLERMCTVTAFAFSAFPDISTRKRKPFNPLLGETFDFVSPDGWRYHSEQVSHHPPISACHAVGESWEWWQDLRLKYDVNPFAKSISLSSDKGIVRLKINGNEEYSWNKASSTVYDAHAEAAKRRLTVWGEMTIRSSTGFEAKLTFTENKTVTGNIQNPAKQKVVTLAGSWDKGLNRIGQDQNEEPLFMPVPLFEQDARCYGFSRFTMALNDLTPEERPFLPRTDSRFRPDRRCLEIGEVENGARAKHALEDAQRKRKSLAHRQMWFHVQPDAFTKQEMWTTNGRYWKSRAAKFSDPHSQAMLKLFETN